MWIAGPLTLRIIYGDDYAGLALVLLTLSLALAVAALALVPTKVISVMHYPHVNCGLNVLTMLLTLSLSAWLASLNGIQGAATGLLIAASIGAVAKWSMYAIVIRR